MSTWNRCGVWCHLHSGGSLLPELGQVLIALLNLFVEALVFNLELLKVDEVQPLCQLLLHNHKGDHYSGKVGAGRRRGHRGERQPQWVDHYSHSKRGFTILGNIDLGNAFQLMSS